MVGMHGAKSIQKSVNYPLIFLRSMVKNGFQWMKPVGLSKDHPSLNLVDWNYRIRNKELDQITKARSLEEF